jgi:hypothetical protein
MDCIKMCLICVFMSLGLGGGGGGGALGFRNCANLAVDLSALIYVGVALELSY